MHWNPSYETGNITVDNEHKEIFALVQKVLDVGFTNRKEKIDTAINFLADYTVKHFSHEENLMNQSQYPGSAQHKEEHKAFVQSVVALKERIMREGDSMQLGVEINETVVNWLITHVLGSDKDLADHYKKWQTTQG